MCPVRASSSYGSWAVGQCLLPFGISRSSGGHADEVVRSGTAGRRAPGARRSRSGLIPDRSPIPAGKRGPSPGVAWRRRGQGDVSSGRGGGYRGDQPLVSRGRNWRPPQRILPYGRRPRLVSDMTQPLGLATGVGPIPGTRTGCHRSHREALPELREEPSRVKQAPTDRPVAHDGFRPARTEGEPDHLTASGCFSVGSARRQAMPASQLNRPCRAAETASTTTRTCAGTQGRRARSSG